uniref:Beta-1,4-glucuronyltransferase 1 n=1 Tax=Lygus hesperus TaxID=30085 RepID=A0A0A9XNH9_LYGHE
MTRRFEQRGYQCCYMLILLLLTVLNVILMLRLLHNGCTKIYFEPSTFQIASLNTEPQRKCKLGVTGPIANATYIFKRDPRLARWDARREYKMMDQALVGERYLQISDEYSVCLATQTSLEKLDSLVQISNHWSGPISIAVFVVSDDEYAIVQEYVKYMIQCFPRVKDHVSFHLAFPKGQVPTSSPPPKSISEWNCREPTAVLEGLGQQRSEEMNQWHRKYPYPQNHMRNLARKNCQTPQVLLTDVDVIPSIGAAEGLNEFFKTIKNCSKCAFVIPTYEVATGQAFPKTKEQLVWLSRAGLARPFHQKVFLHNSFATNHSKWEEDVKQEHVHVSHTVTHFKFYYEPFYISEDSAPAHDERFIGYGLTKNTQVYEMVVAGYEFFVLSPVFMVHWGLQNNLRRPGWREKQNNNNYRKLHFFRKEIHIRYNYRSTPLPTTTAILNNGTEKETVSSPGNADASMQHSSSIMFNTNLTKY